MSDDADALQRTVLRVGLALFAALLVTALLGLALGRRGFDRPVIGMLLRIKLFVSTYNSLLLLVLLSTYAGIYRRMPNPFTLSLLLFALALLLYALSSNPVVWVLLGFRQSSLGVFTFLPDVFAAIAVTVLTYQSEK
jgi:hypothetical protein